MAATATAAAPTTGSGRRAIDDDLSRLLTAAARDPAAEGALIPALLAAQVHVLGGLDADGAADLVTLLDEQGPLVPFFTTEESIRRTLEAAPQLPPDFLRMECRLLWETLPGARLVLDPHGPVTRVFEPQEVEALLDGAEPGVLALDIDPDQPITVTPDEPPVVLLAALTALLAGRPEVAAAHLGWFERGGEAGWLLFVLADDPDVLAGLGDLDVAGLTGGVPLDATVLPSGTGDHLLSGVPPFYTAPPSRTVH